MRSSRTISHPHLPPGSSNSNGLPPTMTLYVRSEVEPIDPGLVPTLIFETGLDQYFQVAVVTVLVYDTVITMDKEVKYFWKTPRKLVNIVYFVNRYIGILGAAVFLFWSTHRANLPLCDFAAWTQNSANWATVVLIDYILMIRVLALYSQDKRLSVCLKALLGLEAAFKFGLFIYIVVTEDVTIGSLAKDVTICGTNIVPWGWGLVDWTIPAVYELLLMSLALYKAAEFWRMSAGLKGFNLVKVLVQDQFKYFILVVACSVLNILEFKLQVSNPFSNDILNCLGNPSFLCILGSRMLINLKEAGEEGLHEGTSYRMESMSEIEFC